MSELRAKAKRTAARLHINHRYNDGSYLDNHLERVADASLGIAKSEGIEDESILEFIYCVAMLLWLLKLRIVVPERAGKRQWGRIGKGPKAARCCQRLYIVTERRTLTKSSAN